MAGQVSTAGTEGGDVGTCHALTLPTARRLAKMCHSLVGEHGEEQLYGAHRRGPTALRELLCHGKKGPCAHLGGSKAGGSAPPKALQNEL